MGLRPQELTKANCAARMKRSKLLLKKFFQFVVVLFIIFFFFSSERIVKIDFLRFHRVDANKIKHIFKSTV